MPSDRQRQRTGSAAQGALRQVSRNARYDVARHGLCRNIYNVLACDLSRPLTPVSPEVGVRLHRSIM